MLVNGIYFFEYHFNYIQTLFFILIILVWIGVLYLILSSKIKIPRTISSEKKESTQDIISLLKKKPNLEEKEIDNIINLYLKEKEININIRKTTLEELKNIPLNQNEKNYIIDYYLSKFKKEETDINIIEKI